MTPGFILAAPASGSGKTVLCAGLLAFYRARGGAVRAFKAGPDYIDPGYHRLASGHDCVNLDPWGMRPETLAHRTATLCADAELVIGEGAMGLFDGARDGTGSTADLAAWLGLPVVLVVDARGQGASVAALAEGFANHRPDVAVAGVILNRIASAAHERLLCDALDARSIPVLGAVPRDEALSLPSRHLGLVQACESSAAVDRRCGGDRGAHSRYGRARGPRPPAPVRLREARRARRSRLSGSASPWPATRPSASATTH